jgi:hypothetical protein
VAVKEERGDDFANKATRAGPERALADVADLLTKERGAFEVMVSVDVGIADSFENFMRKH